MISRLHDAQASITGLNSPQSPKPPGLHTSLQQHDDAEHHRGGADDRRADEHRLGGGLEGVARAVALFELILGVLEVGVEAEVALDLLL